MLESKFAPTIESLAELTAVHQSPCLSLYMPTHQSDPENQQDLVRFRNLVKELEATLRRKYPAAETRHFLEQFEALGHDHAFWSQGLDGLAVMGGAGLFRVFRLPRTVAEVAIVADRFYVKPLRRFLQFVGRYQILGLGLDTIQLFEGDRDSLVEIEPARGVPRTPGETLGEEAVKSRQSFVSIVGASGKGTPMPPGLGAKKDEADTNTERFFRAVDRAVLEHHSRPSGLPLLLAALPEHHHLFRGISHNTFLMAAGLQFNPNVLTISELRERVWDILEPQYHAWMTAVVEEFMEARARGLGSDQLEEVLQAANDGRVAMLLIEFSRKNAGQTDGESGLRNSAGMDKANIDDLLDDLGELVGNMGGQVLVVPTERMPGKTGLAAIFRY